MKGLKIWQYNFIEQAGEGLTKKVILCKDKTKLGKKPCRLSWKIILGIEQFAQFLKQECAKYILEVAGTCVGLCHNE